jgi:hypothetical protein
MRFITAFRHRLVAWWPPGCHLVVAWWLLVAAWWPSGDLLLAASWWPPGGRLVAAWWSPDGPPGGRLVVVRWPPGGRLVVAWWPPGGRLVAACCAYLSLHISFRRYQPKKKDRGMTHLPRAITEFLAPSGGPLSDSSIRQTNPNLKGLGHEKDV